MALSRFKRDEIAWELRHEDAAQGTFNKFNANPYMKAPARHTKPACKLCNFWHGRCCSKFKCTK